MPEQSLVELRIDGVAVKAKEGSLLLPAAREAGFPVPSLCWHGRISPTGACRLCVVKIEGMRGLQTACSTRVRAGMEVTAFDAELEGLRRWLLEALLEEVEAGSDGAHRDELEELALRYGLAVAPRARRNPAAATFLPAERLAVDSSSPVLAFDPARCVKCFRCVKACAEIQAKGVLEMQGRGLEARVGAGEGPWSSSECDGCGECVQLCPTGALVEKAHRAELAEAGIRNFAPGAAAPLTGAPRRILTTCPYCGVGCQTWLLVAGGRILRVEGAEGLSPNDGRLCVKGRFGLDFNASPERLRKPLIRDRRDQPFRECEWEEALDRVARGLGEAARAGGPEAVAGYASAKCTNEENYLFQKLFRAVLGSNNIDYCTRLCHASTVTAMLRTLGDGAGTNSIEDFEAADCVIVIGNNMTETHPVTATYLRRGKARGACLIVVDPRDTPLAAIADVALRPRLGTDVAVLDGMTRIILKEGLADRAFVASRVAGGLEALAGLEARLEPWTPEKVEEVSGVPPADLRKAALAYAGARRAMIATGMGMSQATVGTRNVLALIDLMLVAGKIGREGAGIDPPRGQNNVQGATDVGASPIYLPGYAPLADAAHRARLERLWGIGPGALPAERGLTTVEIAKAAGEGRVKALFVMGENPMRTDPNLAHVEEALLRLDFLAVSDIFMTPTAELADVVLPAASWAEKDGTFVNSDRRVLRVRKALDPPGEAREDLDILLDLATALGRPLGDYADAAAVWEEIRLAAPALFGGIDHARLESGGIQWPCPTAGHPGTSTLFLERFGTKDGLARLEFADWLPQSELPDAARPLVLSTGRLLYHYHSGTMSRRSPPLAEFSPAPYLLVHPADAARAGVAEGDLVRVSSARGAVELRARIDAGVKEGELFAPFHFDEADVNRLTRDELDPDSRIAPFKYTAVALQRIGGPA